MGLRQAMRWILGPMSLAMMSQAAWAAQLTNGDFERGNLSGWTVTTDRPGSATVEAPGTESGYSLRLASDQPYRTDVAQALSGLEQGQYLLTALVRNSGGQAHAYLYARDCGGPERMTSFPVTAGWNKVVVRGVQVTNGRCTIGISIDASANQFVSVDDVAFTLDHGRPYNFLLGGDLSRLSWVESLGAKFYENGRQRDPIDILADNGFNFIRLRPYNDPGNPKFYPSNQLARGFEDTQDTLVQAKRAARRGMQLQLTLNYSDWWGDSCRQEVPHEWVGMTFEQIRKAVYDYTFDIVSKLAKQGTPPRMVSLGNQMQCGLLLKPGNYAPITNWPRLAEILNAGYQAVKDASPTSQVMLHLDSPASAPKFFDAAVAHGVNFDVIGLSWYPYWDNMFKRTEVDTIPELLVTLNQLGKKYNRDIVLMESGWNWSPKGFDGGVGTLRDVGNVNYPMSPAGQRDFLYDLINTCKAVDDGRCVGLVYWDPVAVNQPGFGWKVGGNNSDDNSALFDWSHNALPALKQAFRFNR